MHPYWILPVAVGLGGLLISADKVFQGHPSTGMNILIISFSISAILVVVGWFVGNKEDDDE